jgi:hypothetical protein
MGDWLLSMVLHVPVAGLQSPENKTLHGEVSAISPVSLQGIIP